MWSKLRGLRSCELEKMLRVVGGRRKSKSNEVKGELESEKSVLKTHSILRCFLENNLRMTTF